MSESVLGSNLQQLMRIHGDMSVSELARQANVPQPTLHHILTGTTKKPRMQALESLAKYFSVSISQLIGLYPLPPQIPNAIKDSLKISAIPLIEWSTLKNWFDQTNVETVKKLKEIIIDKKIGDNSFALIMKDTSMEPLFLENSILVFDSDKKPKDRDFVLAYIAKDDLFIFNRLFVDGNDFFIKHNQENGETLLLRLNMRSDKVAATLSEVRMQF